MKLKPVPDINIIKQRSSFMEVNGEIATDVEVDLAITDNDIIRYLDYLRKEIQDLKDKGR